MSIKQSNEKVLLHILSVVSVIPIKCEDYSHFIPRDKTWEWFGCLWHKTKKTFRNISWSVRMFTICFYMHIFMLFNATTTTTKRICAYVVRRYASTVIKTPVQPLNWMFRWRRHLLWDRFFVLTLVIWFGWFYCNIQTISHNSS